MHWSKRAFDLAASALLLVTALPFMVAIGVAVKVYDNGPVLFSQTRVGRGGLRFRILKFRTMSLGSEGSGPSITRSGDPRVTPIGRVLRHWKLDELPQLINVLRGDMSIVGPRPEVPKYVDLYTTAQRAVLLLKPGITDLATLRFRGEEALLANCHDPEAFYLNVCVPTKIALNLKYAERASLWKDIRLIVATVIAIIRPSKPPIDE